MSRYKNTLIAATGYLRDIILTSRLNLQPCTANHETTFCDKCNSERCAFGHSPCPECGAAI